MCANTYGAHSPVFFCLTPPPSLALAVNVDLHAETLRGRDVTAAVRHTGGGGDGSEICFRQGQPREGGGGDARDADASVAVSWQIRPDAIVPFEGGEVRAVFAS